jgi:Fe2+ or Zn2+ uptake regulation protein
MSKPSKQKEERWRKEELAEAIVEYLREHPRASDTLDGIAEWWIMRQHVRVELNTVKNVLRQLIAEGVLREIGEGDSRRYSLNVKRDDLR